MRRCACGDDDDIMMMIIIKLQVLGSHWHSYSNSKKGSTDVGSRSLVQNYHMSPSNDHDHHNHHNSCYSSTLVHNQHGHFCGPRTNSLGPHLTRTVQTKIIWLSYRFCSWREETRCLCDHLSSPQVPVSLIFPSVFPSTTSLMTNLDSPPYLSNTTVAE